MDIQDQELIAALDAFSRNARESFRPFKAPKKLGAHVIAKIKEAPEAPNRQILNSDPRWLGAEFKRAGDDGQFFVFEIVLPRKRRTEEPEPELRIHARQIEGGQIAIISVDVFDCHLADVSHRAIPTLAALFEGKRTRHRWSFAEDFMERRFVSTHGTRQLAETIVIKRPVAGPDPRSLPMAPQHIGRVELLSESNVDPICLARLGDRVSTVGALASLSEMDLHALENVGRKCMNEFRRFFAQLDL